MDDLDDIPFRRSKTAVVALLFALAAGGAGGWALYRVTLLEAAVRGRALSAQATPDGGAAATHQAEVSRLKARIAELEAQLASARAEVQAARAAAAAPRVAAAKGPADGGQAPAAGGDGGTAPAAAPADGGPAPQADATPAKTKDAAAPEAGLNLRAFGVWARNQRLSAVQRRRMLEVLREAEKQRAALRAKKAQLDRPVLVREQQKITRELRSKVRRILNAEQNAMFRASEWY